jgi:hypothetical protein
MIDEVVTFAAKVTITSFCIVFVVVALGDAIRKVISQVYKSKGEFYQTISEGDTEEEPELRISSRRGRTVN